jgi:hypothetical protein
MRTMSSTVKPRGAATAIVLAAASAVAVTNAVTIIRNFICSPPWLICRLAPGVESYQG